MLEKLIAGFIVIFVGVSLLPEISKQVSHCNYDYRQSNDEKEIFQRQTQQTYLDYVKERLEVERLMR